jgi:hypothetical protein
MQLFVVCRCVSVVSYGLATLPLHTTSVIIQHPFPKAATTSIKLPNGAACLGGKPGPGKLQLGVTAVFHSLCNI